MISMRTIGVEVGVCVDQIKCFIEHVRGVELGLLDVGGRNIYECLISELVSFCMIAAVGSFD